jgi:hypothetical protein
MSTTPPPPPPTHFPPLPPPSTRPKNWFERNWKWFVPALIIFCLLIFGGFLAAIFFGVTQMMRTSPPYQVAVERALKNPFVQAKLGTPITVGRFTNGNVSISSETGYANIEIPLRGPNGHGFVNVEAKKRAGTWRYITLVFSSEDGSGINLLDSTLPQDSDKTSLMPPDEKQKNDDGTT